MAVWGIRCFDIYGNLTLEISDRITRTLGIFTVSVAGSTTLTDIFFTTGPHSSNGVLVIPFPSDVSMFPLRCTSISFQNSNKDLVVSYAANGALPTAPFTTFFVLGV